MNLFSSLGKKALFASTLSLAALALSAVGHQAHATTYFSEVQHKSYVEQAINYENLPFNQNVTAGNLIVVSIGQKGTQTVATTPTDSQGNTYTLALSKSCGNGSASDRSLGVWYTIAGSSGSLYETTYSPNAAYEITMSEFSGVDTANPLDKDAYGNLMSSTICQSSTTALWGGQAIGSFQGDTLAYGVVQSPNSANLTSFDGFGNLGGTPTTWTYSSNRVGTFGEWVNAAAKGTIGYAYSLDTTNPYPGYELSVPQFTVPSSVQAVGVILGFRHS